MIILRSPLTQWWKVALVTTLMTAALTVGSASVAMAATPPHITSGSPGPGSQDVSYVFQITTDSAVPVVFSDSGTLPDGLGLTSTGLIFGNPREIGDSTFTIRASNGTAPDASATYTIHIDAPPAPVFVHRVADSGVRGYPYSFSVRETGAATSLLFLVTKGTLPDGLSMTPSTGEVRGKPTTAALGAFFTVTAFDGGLAVASKNYAIPVGEPIPPIIVSKTVPNAVQGEPYRFELLADGIPSPRFTLPVFVVAEGEPTFPSGLSIDAITGVLSGPILSPPGLYMFFVEADNGTRPPATQQFFLTVTAAATTTPTPPPTVIPTIPPTESGSHTGTGTGAGAGASEETASPSGVLANTGATVWESWPLGLGAFALLVGCSVTVSVRKRRSAE